MSKKKENQTTLEELSDEQLENTQGGAELWNGKDKMPLRSADRTSVKAWPSEWKTSSFDGKGN